MRLDHVGIEVRDLYTMELFYRSVLGFRPQYRYVSRNTPGLRTVFLERGGVSLELLERPRGYDFLEHRGHAPQPPRPLGGGRGRRVRAHRADGLPGGWPSRRPGTPETASARRS